MSDAKGWVQDGRKEAGSLPPWVPSVCVPVLLAFPKAEGKVGDRVTFRTPKQGCKPVAHRGPAGKLNEQHRHTWGDREEWGLRQAGTQRATHGVACVQRGQTIAAWSRSTLWVLRAQTSKSGCPSPNPFTAHSPAV